MDPTALLGLLASGVRALGDGGGRETPTEIASASFDALLDRARRNEIGAGRPVELAPEIDQRIELTPEQRGRLAEAVDHAELSGIRRALVSLDGHQLVVDTQSRLVVSDQPFDERGVLSQIDGVVRAGENANERARPANEPNLLDLLARPR